MLLLTRLSLVAVCAAAVIVSTCARPGAAVADSTPVGAGGVIVVMYRAVGAGAVRVVFALTRGDASAKAVAARTYRVVVS